MDKPDVGEVHVHQATHVGKFWDVCMCGAARRKAIGTPPGEWHTCSVCTQPWGMEEKETTDGDEPTGRR